MPAEGEPASWITEDVAPIPKNIYGITKLAAENLCELIHRKGGLPCVVLRTARFFPEDDDDRAVRQAFDSDNVKVNELLYRRVDIEDVVAAHLLAISKASAIGFDRFIISATTPFTREDLPGGSADCASLARGVAAPRPSIRCAGRNSGRRAAGAAGVYGAPALA